jgi:hypothetical protein
MVAIRACLPAGRQGLRSDRLLVYSYFYLRATYFALPSRPLPECRALRQAGACSQTMGYAKYIKYKLTVK